MSKFDRSVRKLYDVIKSPEKSKTSPYDETAEVRRIEGNIAWVHIPGGVDETPVQLTVNAKAGDLVQVRVSGGRAWITGNSTAPPTDDTKAKEAVTQITAVNKVVNAVKTIADKAAKIAANTNQYFWFTESGNDTGAHITEVPQEEFLEDPTNGGGNLLARSNGVAVRDGLTEMATFSTDGVGFYRNDVPTFKVISEADMNLKETITPNGFYIDSGTNTATYTYTTKYSITELTSVTLNVKVNDTVLAVYVTELTPTAPTVSEDYYTATMSQSGNSITVTLTQLSSYTQTVDSITILYTTTTDGVSRIETGIYPVQDSGQLLAVGNGTSSERSNAFGVDVFGNVTPVMEFAKISTGQTVVASTTNILLPTTQGVNRGECFELLAFGGCYTIVVSKSGYYEISVQCAWIAVNDTSRVRLVVPGTFDYDTQVWSELGWAAMGRDPTWSVRSTRSLVYIESGTTVGLLGRDEATSGGTLYHGELTIKPVWIG